jgi:hypothetical protein
MSANVLNDLLRVQQWSNRQALTMKFDARIAAVKILAEVATALKIRDELRREAFKLEKKPIDAVTEWSRWERDVLDFEQRL